MRRFLFVIDPIQGFDPNKDTTFVFMLEAQKRGHHTYTCGLGDLYARSGTAAAAARRTTVQRSIPHYQLFEERDEELAFYDAIFMRKDPPVDQAYLYATYLLSLADPAHTLVFNDPAGLREANEKLYALRFPEIIPPTITTSDPQRLKRFLDELGGRMIIKPLDGCGGAGIFLLDRQDRNLNALIELATDNGRRLIIGQQYLPEVRAGDKRILVLDGEPLGAILRVPSPDEHRGNIHVGGTAERTTLTVRDRTIVERLAPSLRQDGLYFTGLDVIGEYLTEVNVTSPTGAQEINSFDDVSVEARVLDFVESRCPHPPTA